MVTKHPQILELAKQTVEDLFAQYNSLYGTSSFSTSQVGSSSTLGKKAKIQSLKEMIQTTQFSKQSELEVYLSEGSEDPDNPCTVLEWWKVKQNKFLVLARMAIDILAIPITTVSSELAFSIGGRVLIVFRSSLAPKMVESLICAQDWMKGKEEVLLHCNEIEDVETYEFDKALERNTNTIMEGILIIMKKMLPVDL